MSVDNGLPFTTTDKPDRSGSNVPNNLPYFGLARFDTRHSSVNKVNFETPQYKKPYDPDRILEGQPVLECIFCDKYKTAIDFDMELHLLEKHRWELLRQFPIKGKGYSMDLRAEYFVHQIKIRREQIKNVEAMATDMKELIKSTTAATPIDNHQSLDNNHYHRS